jgi:hypothetical protein
MTIASFHIEIALPPSVTQGEAKDYIVQALMAKANAMPNGNRLQRAEVVVTPLVAKREGKVANGS